MLAILQQNSPRWANALKERLGVSPDQPSLPTPRPPPHGLISPQAGPQLAPNEAAALLAAQQHQQQAELFLHLAATSTQNQQPHHQPPMPPPGQIPDHIRQILAGSQTASMGFIPGGPAGHLLGPNGPISPNPSTNFEAAFANPYNPYGFDLNGMRRKNATRETTAVLKQWLSEHRKNPYPTKGEKIMLAIISKMTLTQVSTWFANARRRLKKENKANWQGGSGTNNDVDDDDFGDDLDDLDDEPRSEDNKGRSQSAQDDNDDLDDDDDDDKAEKNDGKPDEEAQKRLAAQMMALLQSQNHQANPQLLQSKLKMTF